ncbi:MAG: hypothetical protein FJ033_10860 [Chloroflexi bacterium]|nr:hypothetical protein [Chloroflexota bacterium]
MRRRSLARVAAAAAVLATGAIVGRSDAAVEHTPPPAYKALICRAFGAACSHWIRIADCETGHTWNARSRGKAGEIGLFQIHPVHWYHTIRSRHAGSVYVSPGRLTDPAFNVRVAYVLSDGGRNDRPWTCRYAANR